MMRSAVTALMLFLLIAIHASLAYSPTAPAIPLPIPITPPPINPPPPVVPPSPPPSSLKTTKLGYWFRRTTNHTQPKVGVADQLMASYDIIALGPSAGKFVYLTFDAGYENGFTPLILDALKEAQVTAAFFVTGQFVTNHPELVKRMHREGHLVANHTMSHPSLAELEPLAIAQELQALDLLLKQLIGEVTEFFRPPMGEYSERSLAIVHSLGYRHVFWSVAYKDWLVNEQPGAAYAHTHVMANIHPGAVILLHTVSQSNTEALPRILADLKSGGWQFRSLLDFRRPAN